MGAVLVAGSCLSLHRFRCGAHRSSTLCSAGHNTGRLRTRAPLVCLCCCSTGRRRSSEARRLHCHSTACHCHPSRAEGTFDGASAILIAGLIVGAGSKLSHREAAAAAVRTAGRQSGDGARCRILCPSNASIDLRESMSTGLLLPVAHNAP